MVRNERVQSVAIVQPNYLPWKGYFDLIHRVDTFVALDCVQYTTRDWRNRNRIKLPNGDLKWLTVPVAAGRDHLIREARIDYSRDWVRSHLGLIQHAYGGAPYFHLYYPGLEAVLKRRHEMLVDLDLEVTQLICGWLGIATRFLRSSALEAEGRKDDRLISILKRLNADVYVTGPSARDYIVPDKFSASGIELVFHDYADYPVYDQRSGPFVHEVSVIDLLFSVGPSAPDYIWG